MNELQSLKEPHFSKETQIMNELQISKEPQISIETQILNEPQILKEPQIPKENPNYEFIPNYKRNQISKQTKI